MKVLMLDDEKFRHIKLKDLVQDTPNILWAKNNAEAIKILKNERIDVLFLDYDLAGAWSGLANEDDSSESTISFLIENRKKLAHIFIVIHTLNVFRYQEIYVKLISAGYNCLVKDFISLSSRDEINIAELIKESHHECPR